MISVTQDITDLKQVEAEKKQLQSQLTQTQKLEAIGRLAGGVAHDLNNLLSPILGYGELLLSDTAPNDPRRDQLNLIVKAGTAARDLIGQLLAFSRKQSLEYKPLNLNDCLESFTRLLRRTIREDIDIDLTISPMVQPILADVGQIEQVIMNLAINASDAMPEGGKLDIETDVVELGTPYATVHPGAQPGKYVMMAFSDTGTGMDEETCNQIFEPFFSTKGEEGTGLGLATVYGIVKQHKGNIWVYSEIGVGTTFKVYLPMAKELEAREEVKKQPISVTRGSGTILLAEDNEHVSNVVRDILHLNGYTVLFAANGTEACSIMAEQDTAVDLLLTDVVMPGMNGRELYTELSRDNPDLKVLFMSGYTDKTMLHRGVLEDNVPFIQKPFTVEALAAKVREVLET